MPTKVLITGAPGINRDEATKVAFELSGAEAQIIPVEILKENKIDFDQFQIIVVPGGFSYGDHIQSGRVMALELQKFLSEQLEHHVHVKKRPLVGVCNGFQMLVQLGLLPFGRIKPLDQIQATLTSNAPQQFQSRWIHLKSYKTQCEFAPSDEIVTYPVAHGEGRFISDDRTLDDLEKNNQVVYRYCLSESGETAQEYPENPNGSPRSIAGVCDPSGLVLGMMPHAEDYVRREHHPNWRRIDEKRMPDGLRFFKNIVNYVK